MISESYRGKSFTIQSPDARLRSADDLTRFLTKANGAPRTIPVGTNIGIDAVNTVPAGARKVNIFVHAMSANGGAELGWTSANNLAGQLLSETIGITVPTAGANRFGPNAAWANGEYLQQVNLIAIVGTDREIEYIAEQTAQPFLDMVGAAMTAGRVIGVNSAFRSYAEQRHLWDGYQRRLPGFNPANRPGTSNHQSGIAFDIAVGAGPGNLIYDWLANHATGYGFVRTVAREPWHWEYLPNAAADARQRGSHETSK